MVLDSRRQLNGIADLGVDRWQSCGVVLSPLYYFVNEGSRCSNFMYVCIFRLSCFVIVPFLYLSTIRNMVRLGHVRSAAKLSAMAGSGGGGGAQSYDSSYASPPPSTSRRGRIQGRGLYSPFYGKLALVPIVFIFIRLGSSIRVWYKVRLHLLPLLSLLSSDTNLSYLSCILGFDICACVGSLPRATTTAW